MKFKTPVSELFYTYVSGLGTPKYGKDRTSTNPLDYEYKATIKLDKDAADKVRKVINDFWSENKPAKIVKPQSTFLKEEMIDGSEVDEYGAPIKVSSGKFTINASTNAAFADKKNPGETKSNKIVLLNSKGVALPASHPLVLGDVGVGEGSKGVVHGKIAITEYEGKAYVKLYLVGIQFAKFVAYEGESLDTEELETEDDGCGTEVDGCEVDNLAGDEVKL